MFEAGPFHAFAADALTGSGPFTTDYTATPMSDTLLLFQAGSCAIACPVTQCRSHVGSIRTPCAAPKWNLVFNARCHVFLLYF